METDHEKVYHYLENLPLNADYEYTQNNYDAYEFQASISSIENTVTDTLAYSEKDNINGTCKFEELLPLKKRKISTPAQNFQNENYDEQENSRIISTPVPTEIESLKSSAECEYELNSVQHITSDIPNPGKRDDSSIDSNCIEDADGKQFGNNTKIKIIHNRVNKSGRTSANEIITQETTNQMLSYFPDKTSDIPYEIGKQLSGNKEITTRCYEESLVDSVYSDNGECSPHSSESSSSNDSYGGECSSAYDAEVSRKNFIPKKQHENINRHLLLPVNNKPTPDKDLCPFCFEDVGHFGRHLIRKHSDEGAVKKISEMKNNSKERRMAIIALRKKGNFILKSEKNELKPMRKPNGSSIKEEDYYPCTACLGYYKKTYMWRHKKKCKALSSSKKDGSRTQHLTEVQTFLAATGSLGTYLDKSRLKAEVFPIMRPDEISFTAKSDPLICLYGESYLHKHKRKQMNVVASNRIREIARLKLAVQKFTTITDRMDILKPGMYNNTVAATKIISGFNNETKTFKASSLALHLETNLKFLCDVARKAVLTKDPVFPKLEDKERDRKLKEISEFRDMICNHWCNDISSLANKVLNEVKYDKPKLLPLTEDIKSFNNYIMAMATTAYEKLKNNEDITLNYKLLAECTLCLLLVFNRKRIGEVQFLDIQSYKKDCSTFDQQEFLTCLSEVEKSMSSCFKRVVVFGKGSKPVPILFTKKMQIYLELLLKIRSETQIVPKSNKYVFANPDSADRWMAGTSIIRKFAYKCGANRPELLTSTKFRKQIATILQLMNFQDDEMDQIARFMGHTEKTHKEFYRLTEDVYQTAKVVKVLLLLNAGKGNELKGKSLSEIQVEQDTIEFDEKDEFDTNQNDSLSEQRESNVDITKIQKLILMKTSK